MRIDEQTTYYRVELVNKIRRGCVIGNLYGVSRIVDGRRCGGWKVRPQESLTKAERLAALMNERKI